MRTSLYRSRTNRVFGGIFGGIGEIYNIDPTLLRLAYAALTLFSGLIPGVILYIIAWAIIPEKITISGPTIPPMP